MPAEALAFARDELRMPLFWKKWFRRRAKVVRYFDCPLCGEPVRVGAVACRSCGSDAQTGWAQESEDLAVDLGPAGEEFDYEAWLEREVGSIGKPTWKQRLWNKRVGGLILVVLLGAALIFTGLGH